MMALVMSLNSANAQADDIAIEKAQNRSSSVAGESPLTSEQSSVPQAPAPATSPDQAPLGSAKPRSIKNEKPMPDKLSGEFPAMSQPDVGTGIIQVTLGLFVVLLIIAAAAWFARRFGQFQATAGGALRIVGGLHLGAKERVVVVQVGDQQLLLGVSPGRVSTLHVLSNPLEQSDPGLNRGPQRYGAFRDKLNAVLKRDSQ
jgi:flagellar protein FliO/FliZ